MGCSCGCEQGLRVGFGQKPKIRSTIFQRHDSNLPDDIYTQPGTCRAVSKNVTINKSVQTILLPQNFAVNKSKTVLVTVGI